MAGLAIGGDLVLKEHLESFHLAHTTCHADLSPLRSLAAPTCPPHRPAFGACAGHRQPGMGLCQAGLLLVRILEGRRARVWRQPGRIPHPGSVQPAVGGRTAALPSRGAVRAMWRAKVRVRVYVCVRMCACMHACMSGHWQLCTPYVALLDRLCCKGGPFSNSGMLWS